MDVYRVRNPFNLRKTSNCTSAHLSGVVQFDLGCASNRRRQVVKSDFMRIGDLRRVGFVIIRVNARIGHRIVVIEFAAAQKGSCWDRYRRDELTGDSWARWQRWLA